MKALVYSIKQKFINLYGNQKGKKLGSSEKKFWLFGVVRACPLGKDLENCPLKKIRKMPISEQFKFIQQLPEDKVNQLIQHHKKCLYKREKEHSGHLIWKYYQQP